MTRGGGPEGDPGIHSAVRDVLRGLPAPPPPDADRLWSRIEHTRWERGAVRPGRPRLVAAAAAMILVSASVGLWNLVSRAYRPVAPQEALTPSRATITSPGVAEADGVLLSQRAVIAMHLRDSEVLLQRIRRSGGPGQPSSDYGSSLAHDARTALLGARVLRVAVPLSRTLDSLLMDTELALMQVSMDASEDELRYARLTLDQLGLLPRVARELGRTSASRGVEGRAGEDRQ